MYSGKFDKKGREGVTVIDKGIVQVSTSIINNEKKAYYYIITVK